MNRVPAILLLTQALSAADLHYTTHWVGNTFGGGDKWVQNFAGGMAVAPDGTCFVCSDWDESGREVGIYKDGNVIGKCEDLHGWGRGGGEAVAISDKYIFVAMTQDGGFKFPEKNKNGQLSFPPEKTKWFGVRRYTREGKPAPFALGRTSGESMLVINEISDPADKKSSKPKAGIAGLCLHDGELFASDPWQKKIHVYDAETMGEKRAFAAERPGGLAVVGGTVYAIEKGTIISAFTPAGKRTGQVIDEELQPAAIAAGNDSRLVVADNSPATQQILIFNVAGGGVPALVRKLGEEEGLYSAPSPGRAGPFRLANPTGVGVDAKGNIYVACNPPRGGCLIRCYPPDRKTPPTWELMNLEFVDVCDADPSSDGTDLYSADSRYSFDPAKPAGKNWQWTAQTLNPFRYPHDLRLRAGHLQSGVECRRIGGKLFLGIRGMWQGLLGLYRLDGDTAVPSIVLSESPYHADDGWSPPGQPESGGWLWRDINGDGMMSADEYLATPGPHGEFWASNVDDRGDIWQGARDGKIFHWTCGGLDKKGTPVYDPATLQITQAPAPITDLLRTDYQPDGDVMYLTGQTAEHSITGGEWGTAGTEVCRFDDWSKPERRKLRYRSVLPYEAGKKFIVSFCVAGDLFFAVDSKSAEVLVHDNRSGTLLGNLKPGPEVHGESGWVDFRDAIRATRRKDGTYFIFVEEDAKGKTLVYHLDDPI